MFSNLIPPEADLPAEFHRPTPWPGVIAGLLVYLVGAAYMIVFELPLEKTQFFRELAIWGMLLAPPAIFAMGWILGFPRWSYSCAALILLIPLYISSGSTPGLTFFGYPTFGREVWGIRALIPLLVAISIGLLITRSFRPLGKFFAQAYADWTLLAYAMSAILPWVVTIAFDEIDRGFSLRFFLVVCALIFAIPSLYLRSRRASQRSLTLIIGTVSVVALTAIFSSVYWYRLSPENVYLPGMLVVSICLALFILWPFVIVGMKRVLDRSVGSRSA